MKADAKLRMDVYQEGQQAFNSGAACPYTDWRAGTWGKGRAAAQAYANRPLQEAPAQEQARQEWLEAFIWRAGFTYGWLNLGPWSRRIAEQAYEERDQ